jgi:hypothetical protein
MYIRVGVRVVDLLAFAFYSVFAQCRYLCNCSFLGVVVFLAL